MVLGLGVSSVQRTVGVEIVMIFLFYQRLVPNGGCAPMAQTFVLIHVKANASCSKPCRYSFYAARVARCASRAISRIDSRRSKRWRRAARSAEEPDARVGATQAVGQRVTPVLRMKAAISASWSSGDIYRSSKTGNFNAAKPPNSARAAKSGYVRTESYVAKQEVRRGGRSPPQRTISRSQPRCSKLARSRPEPPSALSTSTASSPQSERLSR